MAVKEMWSASVKDKFSLIVYLVCVVLALTSKVPLALIIIMALISGIIFQKIEDKRNNFKFENTEDKSK